MALDQLRTVEREQLRKRPRVLSAEARGTVFATLVESLNSRSSLLTIAAVDERSLEVRRLRGRSWRPGTMERGRPRMAAAIPDPGDP